MTEALQLLKEIRSVKFTRSGTEIGPVYTLQGAEFERLVFKLRKLEKMLSTEEEERRDG